jgi:hypothetical protein
MLRGSVFCAALLGLIVLPGSACPQEDSQTKAPGFVIRLQSVDDLISNAKYLANLVGRGEEAKQIEGIVKLKAGKGLEGIDTKRPIAIYGTFGPNGIDSSGVGLIPIADEKAFLELLETLNVKPDKDAQGLYTINLPVLPFPVYFRFANKHAYATIRDQDVLAEKKLLPPAAVFLPGDASVASVSIRLDTIPDTVRRLIIGQIDVELAKAKKQKGPEETGAQTAFKEEMLDHVARQLTALLKQGKEVALRLDLNQKGDDLVLELTVTGKEGSRLAADIADFSKAKSEVAGVIGSDSAMNGLLHAVLPARAQALLWPVFDELFTKAMDMEKDKSKQELAGKAFKALAPTLKAGELDVAFDLRGPSKDKHYTLVVGQKVKDGVAIDQIVRELVKAMPAADQSEVKLDADKVGSIAIHRGVVKKMNKEGEQLFGKETAVYMAVRPDAVFITMGEEGLAVIKEVLAGTPQSTRLLGLEISMARLAPLAAEKQPNAVKAAQAAFTTPGHDKIGLTLEGGKELRLRLAVKTQLIKFGQLMQQGTGEEK